LDVIDYVLHEELERLKRLRKHYTIDLLTVQAEEKAKCATDDLEEIGKRILRIEKMLAIPKLGGGSPSMVITPIFNC